jgi:tRNA (guanine10-N2)-dimethyltransferase
VRLLAHLAGDVPQMAAAEFRAVFEAHGTPFTPLRETPRFLDGHAEVFADDVVPLLSRLGLTHVAAMHLFDGRPGQWGEGALDCCFPTGVPFAVRYVKVDPEAPWVGPDVEREVGALLAPGRPVDLKRPALLARAFLLADGVCVGQQLWESDPKALRERHVDRRPFSSPVSLEPRLARALVNLAVVRPGDTVLDPFCGTGGVLLEAAQMGTQAMGSDLDPEMVAGTQRNLAHFGLKGVVFASDVSAAPDQLASMGVHEVDAVVSDLPYGRSASTGKEATRALYRRAFETVARVLKPGGHAVMGLPDAGSASEGGKVLDLVDVFRVRSHKSLTRHFVRLRKSPRGATTS